MKTYHIYHMHIIDNEFNSEYDFDGYFEDHFEAARFMEENEAVGNIAHKTIKRHKGNHS